ncbi:MAG TPA: hypothetical protein H9987_05235 [Candidatus Luteococcus avicola]|nr:hypothetical protein [Candidatus Luteococcus avicola]
MQIDSSTDPENLARERETADRAIQDYALATANTSAASPVAHARLYRQQVLEALDQLNVKVRKDTLPGGSSLDGVIQLYNRRIALKVVPQSGERFLPWALRAQALTDLKAAGVELAVLVTSHDEIEIGFPVSDGTEAALRVARWRPQDGPAALARQLRNAVMPA